MKVDELDYCERKGCRVPTSDLQPVLVAERTHWSPAEYEQWCATCRGAGDDRDDAYERAAARARSNDFEATGGKDWT